MPQQERESERDAFFYIQASEPSKLVDVLRSAFENGAFKQLSFERSTQSTRIKLEKHDIVSVVYNAANANTTK